MDDRANIAESIGVDLESPIAGCAEHEENRKRAASSGVVIVELLR